MTRPTQGRLFRRLVGSHLALTAAVGATAALVIFALAFLLEDVVYATVVRSTLATPTGDVVQRWRVDEAPAPWRTLAAQWPDGIREWGKEGNERHIGLRTDDEGTRWVAVVETAEVEGDVALAALLATVVVALSLVALRVGYVVARHTLRPLHDLTDRLSASEAPQPADLVAGAGDDEIGFLARELARVLQARERAFAREREFLRDASHELRNPLGVLQGTLELLRSNGTATEIRTERLARAERSVARMRRTVDGLLRLAREESAAAQAAERPLSVEVAELVHEFEQHSAAQVELRLRWRATPPGPPELWLVILRNLLENAVRATEEGSIELVVGTDRVAVIDTGCGMTAEETTAATSAFTRGSQSSGHGLGLAIVLRLAERLGWQLRLQSSPAGTEAELTSSGARSGS